MQEIGQRVTPLYTVYCILYSVFCSSLLYTMLSYLIQIKSIQCMFVTFTFTVPQSVINHALSQMYKVPYYSQESQWRVWSPLDPRTFQNIYLITLFRTRGVSPPARRYRILHYIPPKYPKKIHSPSFHCFLTKKNFLYIGVQLKIKRIFLPLFFQADNIFD